MPITQSRGVVVAMAAGEHLLAAGCYDLASPPVMLAPVLHLAHVAAAHVSVAGGLVGEVVTGEVRSSHPRRRRRRRREDGGGEGEGEEEESMAEW